MTMTFTNIITLFFKHLILLWLIILMTYDQPCETSVIPKSVRDTVIFDWNKIFRISNKPLKASQDKLMQDVLEYIIPEEMKENLLMNSKDFYKHD